MPVELNLDRPRGVRQVPEHERAGRVRGRGERTHVMACTGPEVDFGEHEQRRIAVQGFRERYALDHSHLGAEQVRDTGGDVEVSREVASLGDDHAALWTCAQHRRHQTEQPDRCRIGHQHLARRRTDELPDPVADTQR